MIQTIWNWLTGSSTSPQPETPAAATSEPLPVSSHTEPASADVDTLARTLWGEARGEGMEGMVAVANVVMNRVKKADWRGRAVSEVCLKPHQFSCWLPDDPNLPKMKAVTETDPQFAHALAIAEDFLAGGYRDTTNGATSYYAAGTPEPNWALGVTPCAVIGRHRFYRV